MEKRNMEKTNKKTKIGVNTGKKFTDEHKFNNSIANSKPKLSGKKFSNEEEEKICKEYNDGKSIYQLAKDYCFKTSAKSLIRDILLRNNIKLRQSNYNNSDKNLEVLKNKYSQEVIDKELAICNRFISEKITIKSLADNLNMPKTSLRSLLLRNNVDLKERKFIQVI
jgi:hypothetical protein